MSEKDSKSQKRNIFYATEGYLDIFPKRDLWREIAKKYAGDFKIINTTSKVIERFELRIPYKKWIMKLTESDIRPLKFEIKCNYYGEFDLIIGHEDYFEKLLKKLGKREIEIGNVTFDEHYLIKGSRKDLVTKFFTEEIMKGFLDNNIYSFSCLPIKKLKQLAVLTVVSRTVNDKEVLEALINLHCNIIDSLVDINVVG